MSDYQVLQESLKEYEKIIENYIKDNDKQHKEIKRLNKIIKNLEKDKAKKIDKQKELVDNTEDKDAKYGRMNCYVYKCLWCGEDIYINKKNNQLRIFEYKCKCTHPKSEYMIIGEGNFENKEIKRLKYNDEKSDAYVLSRLGKRFKEENHKIEVYIEKEEE